MKTLLVKTVTRQTLGLNSKDKPMLVSLEGGDELSFKAKGSRTTYTVALGHCYRLAQLLTFDEQYAERLKEYNRKKNAGYKRLKRPRRIRPPFDEMYFKILNEAPRGATQLQKAVQTFLKSQAA